MKEEKEDVGCSGLDENKPFPGVKVGPSCAGMPLTIMLDAFFQRAEHGNFVGKAVQQQLSLYPPN